MPTNNTWNNAVTAANVTFSGGTMDIGADATSGAINIGTGAAARTTTIGNTSGASVLALKCGTGDFTLASATGTIISALDTGEITYPLQSAFQARLTSNQLNKTGDGTVYTIVFDTETFDQNSDYNNGTGTFTAPVAGRYLFNYQVGNTEANTATLFDNSIRTSNREYRTKLDLTDAVFASGQINQTAAYADMDAADTCYCVNTVAGTTKTVDVLGEATNAMTYFGGQLLA
jgi:hypothetical protein